MTTELEEQFYKTFGIEPFCDLPCNKRGVECTDNTYCGNKYPEITDRKLLKLICKAYCLMFSVQGSSIELLKENILKEFIYWQEDVDKSEIQQLFKEKE